MRSVAAIILLGMVGLLLGGCGGGADLTPAQGQDDYTALPASSAEIEMLTRAFWQVGTAKSLALNENPDDVSLPDVTRIKAMHIWLLMTAVGPLSRPRASLMQDVKGVIAELEKIALQPGLSERVRTAALDLASVGTTMVASNAVNPALFVGYPGNLTYEEGIVPVPEEVAQAKLLPNECLIVVEKIRGIRAQYAVIRDPTGQESLFHTLWIPVEVIKTLRWCYDQELGPHFDPAADSTIHIIQEGQLMTMLELFNLSVPLRS